MIVLTVARPGLDVASVTCGQHHAGWSAPETQPDYRVVLVRRGRFRRRVGGHAADLDPSVGYVGLPADVEHFAHPAGGDACTSVRLRPGLWRALTGGVDPAARTIYVDAHLDLAHRRLLRAARDDDVDYAVVERLVVLLSAALRVADAPGECRDRALVERARDAIRSDDPAAGGLLSLAARLDASPFG
jgi:hypothetical protein